TAVRILSSAGLLSIEPMPSELAMVVGMQDMARPISVAGKLIRPAITLGFLVALAWLCRNPVGTRGPRDQGTRGTKDRESEARRAGLEPLIPRTLEPSAPWTLDPSLWLEFSLVLLAMLLMGERTWKHHATTLPIVYLSMWYALTCMPLSEGFRAKMVIGLA